ncbi:hypothetical protein BGW41_001067 [Actinomortierella wolfii]|nr:hypothetical protein BGW41_001067 [Actinomortierella wolfii]
MAMATEDQLKAAVRLLLRPTETCSFAAEVQYTKSFEDKPVNRILAIVVNTQAGVEEASVFLLRRNGPTASVLETVLPVYFDFRISAAAAPAKPNQDGDAKPAKDSKSGERAGKLENVAWTDTHRDHGLESKKRQEGAFVLKLVCEATETVVLTEDLMTLQGLLTELRRLHLIAQEDHFYAGGSSHRWVQYYAILNLHEHSDIGSSMSPDEFVELSSNPLSTYYLQPEDGYDFEAVTGTIPLDLAVVKDRWIEDELSRRESEFTEYQTVSTFVGTWNVNGKSAPENVDAWLHVKDQERQPDLYVLCFQELDLSAEAYIVTDNSKEEEWTRCIANTLGDAYEKVVSKQLVGLFILMFASKEAAEHIREVATHSAGCGIMNVLANKGAVAIRIRYKDSHLCFIGSHLAADTSQLERRNQDYQELRRRLTFPIVKDTSRRGSKSASGQPSLANIFECDHTIWAGDLNYRIALTEEQVKFHLKTNDFDTLLKHDQLVTQKILNKTFQEFEEGPISFPPTYKFDVGTDTYDTSEKRRVPSYTDRILWRTKDPQPDSVEQIFYRTCMDLKISDHKPVSALFNLKIKSIQLDKQDQVHQAINKELDRYEKECIPESVISTTEVFFDEVRYLEPQTRTITIENTGEFLAQFRFKPKLDDKRYCKHWVWANPPLGLVMPGEKTAIHITVMVDNISAPMLNRGREKLDDILILHMEHGKDYFISVSGNYVRTCFGNSLDWLSRLDRPIRLWDPEEDDDDDDDLNEEEAVLQRLDPDRTLTGSNGSTTGASKAVTSTESQVADSEPFVVGDDDDVDSVTLKDSASSTSQPATAAASSKAPSLVSMTTLDGSDNMPLKRSNSTNSSNTKAAAAAAATRRRATTAGTLGRGSKKNERKRRSVRQLSIPRDLWRIVDFIYKHGIYVDNLFMLSGDQATMRYIRECLDTGEEFDVERLCSSSGSTDAEKEQERERERESMSDKDAAADAMKNNDVKGKKGDKKRTKKDKEDDEDDAAETEGTATVKATSSQQQQNRAVKGQQGSTSALLSPQGSNSDLRPQIARPVSIMNGLPPKSALFFGQSEHMGMHSMAEVLLLFLDSLSDPVVPSEMYYRALEVCNDRQACYGLLDLMPPVNVNVFVYLTSFLREIILLNHARVTAAANNNNNNNVTATNGDGESVTTGSTPTPSIIVASGGAGDSSSNMERTGSIYNGNDGASIMSTNRAKREMDEDHRVAKLAAVFSKVMLRPPAGSERLSDIEALKKKRFLMHFLHEPKDDDRGGLGAVSGGSNSDLISVEGSSGSGSGGVGGPASASRAGSGTISTKGSRGSLNDK